MGALVVKVYHQVEQLNPGVWGGSNTNAAPTPVRRLPFASVGWETPLTGTYSISSIFQSTKSPSRRSAAATDPPAAKRI